ncbi:MAG: amino acid permease [Candidatus Tyloplasma litorale]|nr:MAG: amino acid permease [Mycoplasmatales bacterium]
MKKTTNTQQKNKSYGLLSMMAMIVGIVIGMGIFVKNAGLVSTNGSVLNTAIAWFIGSIIIISITIAFIEILTITEITGEQSTISNWGKHLLGVKFGKFIGFYITLIYFPIIIASLFQVASMQLIDVLQQSGAISDNLTTTQYVDSIIGISAILLIIVSLINSTSTKPGKYFQNLGTTVKTIPIFFILILFVVLLFANIDSINFNQEYIPNTSAGETAIDPNKSNIELIFMTMPAILFSFDGFLLAGALSKEAKSKNTFKWAFIFSMIFIIVIYFLFSMAVLGIGDSTQEGYGTITNAIYAGLGPEHEHLADILSPIVEAIIVISILTGVSGCTIASYRNLSDLSAHNSIKDPDLKYITKNKFGVSMGSGFAITTLSLAWFVISIGFCSILAFKYDDSSLILMLSDFASNLVVIIAFILYVAIMIAALFNRFRNPQNRIPVKKNAFFIPSAIIGSIMTLLISIYFAYTIFDFGSITFDTKVGSIAAVQLIFTIIVILAITFIISYNSIKTHNMSDELIIKKNNQLKEYYGQDYDPKAMQAKINELIDIEVKKTIEHHKLRKIEKEEKKKLKKEIKRKKQEEKIEHQKIKKELKEEKNNDELEK